MTDVRRAAVADDVGGPLVLGSIGVTSTDVAGLKRLKVLESAEFIGHFGLWRFLVCVEVFSAGQVWRRSR